MALFGEADGGGHTLKQVRAKVSNAGQNCRGTVFTDMAGIVTKNDIQLPMQGILETPISTYRLGKKLCLRRDLIDEITLLKAARLALQTFALHYADAAMPMLRRPFQFWVSGNVRSSLVIQ